MKRLSPIDGARATLPTAGSEPILPVLRPVAEAQRTERQLLLIMEWRRALERAGYQTLISLAPPLALVVHHPRHAEHWVAVSPSGLLVVFERDEFGHTWSEFHLLQRSDDDSDGPSAEIALAAAAEHIGHWVDAPSAARPCIARRDDDQPCDGFML